MNITKNLTSLRKDLLVLFIISLITIFIIDFWLINIPEIFKGGAILGKIFYKLSFSYVSAFIFYFLVVHLKNQNDKKNLYSYVAQLTIRIIEEAKGMLNKLSESSNITLESNYPSKSELNKICSKINPNNQAPLLLNRNGEYANWIQFFEYHKIRSNEASNKILSKLQFLDSELVTKLAKIEDCGHFYLVSNLVKILPIKCDNLIILETDLFSYFEMIKDLEYYFDKKLKAYK
jgi:hypothetical protein